MRSHITGFLGAVAVVASGAFLAISLAALLELAATPNLIRSLAVAGLVGLFVLMPPPRGRWRGGAVLGLATAVVGILAIELLAADPSLGAGQIGALAATPLVIPVLRAWWGRAVPTSTLTRVGLSVVLLLVGVALVRAVLEGGPLGHDESAYALKARAWIAGTPHTGWDLHRAPLNSMLAVPVVALTEDEVPFRLIGAVLGLGSLAAVGLVAHRLGNGWSAVVAAATVGASLPFLRRSSEFLTDVPAAGLLLVVVWVVIAVADDPTRNRRLVLWLAPLVALAFYMRYQSALAVVGIVVAALLAWPGVMRQLRRELLWAGGITLVALLPHLVWATLVTGSPWGVVLDTQGAAGREFLGEGLVDYFRMFPNDLAGPVGAVLMLAGFAWIIWHLVGRQNPRTLGSQRRLPTLSTQGSPNRGLFVLVVVLVAVVPLGLVAHGEPRFVFFPVWLLIAAGSGLVVQLVGRTPGRLLPAAVAVAALMWLPLFSETVRRADRNAEARGETFAVVEDASNFIEFEDTGSCGVLTTYQPQVTWYSTCFTQLFRPATDDLGLSGLNGDRRYAVLFVNGKREPTGEQRQAYLELGPTEVVPARNDAIGDATIVEVTEG